jgi:hypothetical protein
VIVAAVGMAPLAAVAWLRWRFRSARMNARADRLLADARARMQARDDAALVTLLLEAPLGHSPAAKRVRGLVDERRFVALQRAWGDLWPELLCAEPPLALDLAIDLGAAISVLAQRHVTTT